MWPVGRQTSHPIFVSSILAGPPSGDDAKTGARNGWKPVGMLTDQSAEEILNILFIDRRRSWPTGPGGWSIDTDHLNASPDKRGMGSSVEFNVDRPCIRCRRKAVDVLERGQRHAVLFMFMETGPFAGDRCWKLSAGIRLETSSLRLRGGGSTRDSRTSVTSRLGKEAYEGWMVLGRMCVFVSSSLGDNIVFSFFFFFHLGNIFFERGWLVSAWMTRSMRLLCDVCCRPVESRGCWRCGCRRWLEGW